MILGKRIECLYNWVWFLQIFNNSPICFLLLWKQSKNQTSNSKDVNKTKLFYHLWGSLLRLFLKACRIRIFLGFHHFSHSWCHFILGIALCCGWGLILSHLAREPGRFYLTSLPGAVDPDCAGCGPELIKTRLPLWTGHLRQWACWGHWYGDRDWPLVRQEATVLTVLSLLSMCPVATTSNRRVIWNTQEMSPLPLPSLFLSKPSSMLVGCYPVCAEGHTCLMFGCMPMYTAVLLICGFAFCGFT